MNVTADQQAGQSAPRVSTTVAHLRQRGGSTAERSYLGEAVQRLSKKLGRVQVQRLRKGHCETTIMWVTPGEQEIRISASEKRG